GDLEAEVLDRESPARVLLADVLETDHGASQRGRAGGLSPPECPPYRAGTAPVGGPRPSTRRSSRASCPGRALSARGDRELRAHGDAEAGAVDHERLPLSHLEVFRLRDAGGGDDDAVRVDPVAQRIHVRSAVA